MINPSLALFSLLACAAAPADTKNQSDQKNLVQTAAAAGNFQTLLRAAQAAGLAETLASKGPFTILAPTDAAFAKLPKGTLANLLQPANRPTLQAILKNHVISGKVGAAAALQAGTAETLGKTSLSFRLEAGQLRVGSARVLKNDLPSSNGIIHVIDQVLVPSLPKRLVPLQVDTKALIETAIDRGVPLFNAGQQAACAAIYEVAVRGLLQEAGLSAERRAALFDSLRRARGESSAVAAWTLRASLDATYRGLGAPAAPPQGTRSPRRGTSDKSSKMKTSKSLFEFDAASEATAFRPLNDTVMGGRSRSRIRAEGGLAVFSGDVSLENNGGFASVRCGLPQQALRGAEGVVLRVRGDGRKYRFTAQRRRANYDFEFVTEAGVWTEVKAPFAELRRNIRGYRPRTPAPKAEQITGVGLLIGDKRAGEFLLEIDWIRAYGG